MKTDQSKLCSVCGHSLSLHHSGKPTHCPEFYPSGDFARWKLGSVFTPAEERVVPRNRMHENIRTAIAIAGTQVPESLVVEMTESFNSLEGSHAALLSALEAIVAFNTPLPCGLLEQARAAISAARGEQS